MNYSYTIDGTDVTPRGEWTISNEQNEGQIFFRRKLQGDLTFIGADYDLIMASADCDVLEFKIFCGVTEFWEGKFKFPYDFDIDEDSCVCVGTPEVVDEYSCIMDHYDFQYPFTTFPAPGAIQPIINDCAAANLHTLPFCVLMTASTASGNANFLGSIINDAAMMNCGLTLSSSFMWRDNFPNGTNYAGAYATNNYITGATNRLEFLFLGSNTSFRVSFGGTLCDGFVTLSFKELEEVIRNRFNAYWFIDQNGDFRIEHIHFFDRDFVESDFETGINLKTLISNNKRSYAFRRNKYTYETGDLFDQEFFSWQHYEGTEGSTGAVPVAHGVDFAGVPIFYGPAVNQKSDCVPGEFKEKDIATPQFWSDIQWGWDIATVPINAAGSAKPDTISCPGWCILDVDTGTNWIRCEASILGAGNILNGHMATALLQEAYFTWDRIFIDGDMNTGNVVLFDSAMRLQLQEAIEFERCCSTEFNPLDFVETELGSGRVKAATEKMRSIDIELLY